MLEWHCDSPCCNIGEVQVYSHKHEVGHIAARKAGRYPVCELSKHPSGSQVC